MLSVDRAFCESEYLFPVSVTLFFSFLFIYLFIYSFIYLLFLVFLLSKMRVTLTLKQ